jgi:hypothetical protein
MTNTLNSPTQGFQTFQRADGGAPTAGMTPVWIASTDAGTIFRGDLVVTSSGGGTNNSGAYITSINNGPNVTSTGVLVRGVFQGCYQFQPAAGRTVWSNFYNGVVTGSTGDIKAYIVDDPFELFLVQASTKGAVTSSMVGLNIGPTFNSTSGNTTIGYSNVTVESTSVTSSNTQPLRIVDLYSAYAPGGGAFGNVNFNSSVAGGIINGLDNANPANLIVVRLNNCDRLNLTARSS